MLDDVAGGDLRSGRAVDRRRSARCSTLKPLSLAEAVLAACRARGWRVATAESCTGGLVAAALTAIAGSSDVVERGFVTYSNEAKIELLGVPEPTHRGAWRGQRRDRGGDGARRRARAPASISRSRSPASPAPAAAPLQKPVGLVYLGIARRGRRGASERRIFPGDRAGIRHAALVRALEMLQKPEAA